ncbi:camp-binding domain-like protein [Lophium mytilinum]|uniref:cAMP-dependent protein kinase regulatory subunit n=1 Tax=Lophium mytilinum TaxID=390894 RepID=A0A6A6RFW3_9PEZI|nr:camp-binding domain-like protein [Lophium mytilinum]
MPRFPSLIAMLLRGHGRLAVLTASSRSRTSSLGRQTLPFPTRRLPETVQSRLFPKPVFGPPKPDAGAAVSDLNALGTLVYGRARQAVLTISLTRLAYGSQRPRIAQSATAHRPPLIAGLLVRGRHRSPLAAWTGFQGHVMAETAPGGHCEAGEATAPQISGLCRILGGRESGFLCLPHRAEARRLSVGRALGTAAPARGDAAGRASRRDHGAAGLRAALLQDSAHPSQTRLDCDSSTVATGCGRGGIKSPAASPRASTRHVQLDLDSIACHPIPSLAQPTPYYLHSLAPQSLARGLNRPALPACPSLLALRIRHCVLCRPSHGSSVIPALLASLANQRQRSAGPPQPLPSHHHTSMSLPPDYSNEISTLNREILKHSPQDVLQFCANFFHRRLESQRAEFLLSQHHSTQGGGMAESTFPGSNPFGSSPSGGLSTAGMHRLEEEEENDTVASPTAQSFPRSTDAAPSSGESSFGNFGGFQSQANSRAAASKSQPPSSLPMDPQSFPNNYNMNRRTSVSAESLNPTSSLNDNWTPPYHQKTEDQQTRLKQAVSGNFLFSHLDDEQSAQVLGALQEKPIPTKGIKVIQQGDVGDYFYVVEDGHFDIYVNKSGKLEAGPDGLGNKVGSVGPGGSFGELALMYNAPRAATVASTESSTLWALDRVTFRRILMDSAFQRRRMYEGFLEEVPLLSSLTPYERSKIADALETRKFPAGTTIIQEGDVGESFFILESGSAEVYKRGIDKAVNSYKKGDYFGELALLNDAPRAASVVSNTEVKVATLGKDGFQRLLGPVEGIMRRNDPSKLGTEGVDPLAKGK